MDTPVTVQLDRARPIRWTRRAAARLGSLARPPSFADIAHKNGSRAFYALCAHVWAALTDTAHDFEAPEDLAVHLESVEQQSAAFAALLDVFVQAGILPEKKSPPPADAKPGSTTGPSPSSSSAHPVPASKT